MDWLTGESEDLGPKKTQTNKKPTNWISNLLSPRDTVPLEKLTVAQPVKKFPSFFGAWWFITAFTRARHLTLSSARSIPSILRLEDLFFMIFPSTFRLSNWSVSLRSPYQNRVFTSHVSHTCHIPRLSHSFDVEYIYGFVWWGSASKVDDVTALPSRAVTRWRICVTMATLWQQQDGRYALLWKLYSTSSTVQS